MLTDGNKTDIKELLVQVLSELKNAKDIFNNMVIEDLLWTSANPTSEFAKQAVTVAGLSDYEFCDIEFYFHSTVPYSIVQRFRVANGTIMSMNDAGTIYRRNISCSGDTLTISDQTGRAAGSATAAVTDNKYLIPVNIYGVNRISWGGVARLLNLFRGCCYG